MERKSISCVSTKIQHSHFTFGVLLRSLIRSRRAFLRGSCCSRLGAALKRKSAQSELAFFGDCCGCSVGAFALSILTATKPVMF